MPRNLYILVSIRDWFRKAKPQPVSRDLQVQIGVHIEEVSEMLDAVNPLTISTARLVNAARDAMTNLADHLKTTPTFVLGVEDYDRINFLDALCDQIVTATGCAVYARMDLVAALDEVDRSNWSKFDQDGNPLLAPTGKIIKGPNYSPPDLKLYT